MPWEQTYDPLGHPALSTAAAAVPVVLLLALLGGFHWAAHRAALAGLAAAAAVAALVYGMPADALAAAAGYGAAFGLLPIGWTLVSALFLYNLTVASGQFEIVKESVASLSADRRVQVVLIAFCFGAFLEGAAGFGFPVAICAALLMGLGFHPLQAAGLALIANTSPVAFGSLGTPIVTLAAVTADAGTDPAALANLYGKMAGRQLPFFSVLVPVWLVAVMGGLRALRGVWPATLTAGGSFALVQHLTAEHLGPGLVDVTAGLAALLSMAVLLRFWQPAFDAEFAGTPSPPGGEGASRAAPAAPSRSAAAVLYAWTPWLIMTALILVWAAPPVKKRFDALSAPAFEVPGLHRVIARGPEVRGPDVPVGQAVEDARYKLNWISATGTGMLLAAVLSSAWLGIGPGRFVRVFAGTLHQLRLSLATIVCMLALGFVTKYSGQDVTLGLAFTQTGAAYPFFSAMLGWLGVALTGSDTSSNVLFGNLQKITAHHLSDAGVLPLDRAQAATLLCTANSTGGVMGKMVDAQSIVVASAATGWHGHEGRILRLVFWHSLILASLVGLLVTVQAYWWTAAVPTE